MPRPPRTIAPGAFYHVVTRGNNHQRVFDDVLRAFFVPTLGRVGRRMGWQVYGWAVMDNHYHAVLQVGDAGLSSGMCELNTLLARASNVRLGRIDHCFGRRYWCAHLRTEHHLLLSLRYAMWNPPRAGVCDEPGDSLWTSFRAAVGLDPAPPVLARAQLLELFDPNPVVARRAFSDFVSEGRVRCQAPWDGPASR
jgi:REP-associated tyrosine transposase